MSNQHYFDVPFAFAGDVTAVPDPLQVGGTVSFTEGWNFNYQRNLSTDPAALPIDRSTMNWLLLQITTAIAALQKETVPEWIAAAQNGGVAISYGLGSTVLWSASGSAPFGKYVSVTANNALTPSAGDPLGTTTGWQVVCDPIATGAQAATGTNNASIMTPLLVAQQTALRALLAGSATQVFNVGPATAATHAVEYGQLATVQGAFKNLQIAPSSNTLVSMTYDEGVLEAPGGLYMTARNAALSISTASTGANGIDTGTVAAATWYSVWDIYNPTTGTLSGMLSLSATAPTMPSGYTFKARRGWVRTQGSAFLIRTMQLGRQAQYVVDGTILATALPTMAFGIAGTVGTPTWVAVPVGGFVPSTAARINFIAGNQTAATGSIIVAPNNKYAGLATTGSNTWAISTSSAFPLSMLGSFLLESTNIFWASNLAGNAISCVGWEDNI